MNKKGILLLDSLISLIVVSCLAILSLCLFTSINNYSNGYDDYQVRICEKYEDIYSNLAVCEKCQIEEEDLSQ